MTDHHEKDKTSNDTPILSSAAEENTFSDEIQDDLSHHIRDNIDNDTSSKRGSGDISSGSDSSSDSYSSSSDDEEEDKKRSKKKRKKDEKKRKRSKEKKSKKEKKEKKSKQEKKSRRSSSRKDSGHSKSSKKGRELSETELALQRKIDSLDKQSQQYAEMTGSGRLSALDQASLLHADLATRAASLGLPKGLIRTTGGSLSGMFSSGGQFGDASTRKALKGGFGEGSENPATIARMKRERQAQKAEARARQILEERKQRGSGDSAPPPPSLLSKFSGGTIQR